MNPRVKVIVTEIVALQRVYGRRLLVAAGEPDSSIVRDAILHAKNTTHDLFNNDDVQIVARIRSLLDRGYCVGVVPAGRSEVVIFSGPALRFPGVQVHASPRGSSSVAARAPAPSALPPRTPEDVDREIALDIQRRKQESQNVTVFVGFALLILGVVAVVLMVN